MLRAVDVALRVAKRSGRHQLSVYAGESFSDHGPGGARDTLERLISGDGLAVVMQPITTLRPSYLKLDRSLISGIDADPDRGALVTAMLGYARQTKGHLVAEGVETEAELETLRVLGVDLVQGYYLARPGWPWPEVRQTAPGVVTTRAPVRALAADRVSAPRL